MSGPEPWQLNWTPPPGAPQTAVNPATAPAALPGFDATAPIPEFTKPIGPEAVSRAVTPKAPAAPAPWEMNWQAPEPQAPSAYSKLMGTFDRWSLDGPVNLTGVDPTTYRGRNPDGSLITADQAAAAFPAGPVAKAPDPRGAGQLFMDNMQDTFSPAGTGFTASAKRYYELERRYDALDWDIAHGKIQGTGPDHFIDVIGLRKQIENDYNREIQETRDQRALRDSADPVWSPNSSIVGNIGREASSFGGGIVGDINPTYAFGGELLPIGERALIPLAERFAPRLAPAVAPVAPVAGRMVSMGTVNAGVDAGLQTSEMNSGLQQNYDPSRTAGAFLGGMLLQGLGEGAAAGARRLRDWWGSKGVKVDGIPDEQLVSGSLDGSLGDGPLSPEQVDGILRGVGGSPEQFSSPEVAAAAARRVLNRGNAAGIGSKGAPPPAEPILFDGGGPRDFPDLPQVPDVPPVPDAPTPGPRGRGRGGKNMVDITLGAESGGKRFNKDGSVVTSPVGARGEMQVMPDTARDPGHGIAPSNGSLDDDARVGRELLGKLMTKYGNDPAKAWAAYNWGEGHVDTAIKTGGDNWLRSAPAETQAYVAKNVAALGGSAPTVGDVPAVGGLTEPSAPASDAPPAPGNEPSSADKVIAALGDRTPPELLPWASEGKKPTEPETQVPAKAPAAAEPAPPSAAPSTQLKEGQAAIDAGAKANLEAMAKPPTPEPAPRPAIPEPTRPPVVGGNEQAVTARGRPVDTQFEVHEARDLVSSDNPAFDPALQPRDRAGRSSSDAEIARIASTLDPEQLHSSRQAAQGAPIIGPDRMVESGNGRVSSIRRAYELHPEKAKAYRDMIEARGMSTEGFDQPVLVRRRTTEMQPSDRQSFVREANERDTMGMSSTEQAKVDAGTLSRDALDLYRGGSVTDAGNRDFVRRWMDDVATPAERNTLIQPDGSLSADGVRRIRTSMLGKAFDDTGLVSKIVEDPDTEIRAIGNTLTDAAPAFAKIKERVASGDLPSDYDITGKVAEAAHLIARARSEGKKVGDLIHQDDMFAGKTDPVTEAVTRLMFKDATMSKPRSAADMAEGLRFFTSEAEKHSGSDMFGGAASKDRALDILDAARAKLDAKQQPESARLFAKGSDEGLGQGRDAGQLVDALDALKDHSSPAVRELAGKLSELVGDAKLRIGGDLGKDVRGTATATEAAIARAGDTETVLHEAIHVATLSRYGELVDGAEGHTIAPEVRALNDLRSRAQKAFDRRGADPTGEIAHALSSTDEFLAGGLTSPRVQAFLKRNSTANLWGRFVDGVRAILGLPKRATPLLDKVLDAGGSLLDKMKAEPKAAAEPDGVLFSKGRDDEKSWGALGDILFDPEFRSGDAAAARDAVRSTFGAPKPALRNTIDRMKAFGEVTAYSSDGALRSMAGRFNSPTLAKLADLFHAEAGKTNEAVARTYDEAVSRQRGRFLGDLNKALKEHQDKPASMQRIRDLLASPTKDVRATVEERAAAASVRDLLKEVLEYRHDAGETLGEVKDGYFPRLLRADKVFADPTGFLAKAEKTYLQAGLEPDDARASAAAWLQANMDGHLGIADGLQFAAGSSGSKSAKPREFGTYADENLRDFYETNPLTALTNYIAGSIKKAEENRRFGIPGREGSTERLEWVGEHKDKTQWEVMRDQIRDELRQNGAKATGVVERAEQLRLNNLGKVRSTSPRVTAAVSLVHVWNQLGTLGRAVFSSLPEIAMGFVRAGPRLGFTHMATTMGEVGRAIRRADPSDAARYAEAVGAIGADNSLALLRARADDPAAHVAGSKLLDQFYRKSGLEAWTRSGRTAAVKTGQKFMGVLADDLASPTARVRVRAAGYLRELGIKDPQAFAERLRTGSPSPEDLRGKDAGFEAEYATALLRFADQSVLLPNRAVKPGWASHPLGSLIFALQSYNYAFKKQVLDRVGRETVAAFKERDITKLAPAAGLVMLTGITAMITGLRHQLYGGNGDPAHPQSDTAYALETADRAGLFGAMSPLFNAFAGLRYRRSVGHVLEGSVLGRAFDGLDAVGTLATNNSPTTNTAERKAAGAVYDLAVKPFENAIGAGVLRGPLGSSLILGSGASKDGALPSDKEWFMAALAGQKKDRADAADDKN